MKKLLIACGVLVLLVIIAAAGAAYYIYRQVAPTVAQFAELSKLPDIEKGIRNRARFEPPASAEVTESQIQKLVQVQAEVRKRLGTQVAAMEAKYKTLLEKKDADVVDGPALLRAYGDLAVTWMEAKRAQVDALNAAGLSLEEYRWIREQAYRALGMPFMDLDLVKLADEARRGVPAEVQNSLRGALEATGPDSNRTLVAKFKKMLEENVALAAFGL